MPDSSLSDYAAQRVSNIKSHPAEFLTLKPSADDINALLIAYDKSLALVGKTGTPSDTNTKNENRALLEIKLNDCAAAASLLAGSNISLYLLTGFGMKSKSSPVTALEIPQILNFKQGSFDGSVYATIKPVKYAKSYEMCVGTTNNPATMTKVTVKSSSPILITDLTPMTVYFGRCRAIGARNVTSDWGQIVEFKVM